MFFSTLLRRAYVPMPCKGPLLRTVRALCCRYGRGASSCVALLLAATVLLCAAHARAETWTPSISDTALPPRIVAVDKGQQKFYLYEKQSPLALRLATACTTGQLDGDKQATNDLRTPEGVYFVDYKIANGLDFKEYGGIAYTLNYPNPVDKLRGKTGYGIWIHSKGFGIVPKDTRGCIAIGLKEIDEIGSMLTPGTAVVVGESIRTEKIPQRDDGTIRHLRIRMDQWTRAWASRSHKLFDFYDPESYSKAMPESFSAFRTNKERLFKRFAWINIFNREVHVLAGPGYWVTWSEQFYRAPNLSTEGIRRLYWQRTKDKQFRIVGMEWLPRNVGMQAAFEQGKLVATMDGTLSDASAEAPIPPPLSMPESADSAAAALPPAPQPVATAMTSVPATPKPAPAPPSSTSSVTSGGVPPVNAVPHIPVMSAEASQPQPTSIAQSSTHAPTTNSTVTLKAPYAPEAPEVSQPTAGTSQTEVAEVAAVKPSTTAPATMLPSPILLDTPTMQHLQQRVEAWRNAWQLRSPAFFNFYDQKLYGTLKDIPHRDTFRALKADMTRRFRAAWIEVVQRPARMEVRNNYVVTTFEQILRVPSQPAAQGLRHLYWQRQQDNEFRIVASHWETQDVGMQADYLESITPTVTSTIEAWRKAWEDGDVPSYMTFYAQNARQQGKGKEAIRQHKTTLWAKAAPKLVSLSGLRVLVEAQGVRADMTQVYRDSTGRGDKGTKTLLLQPNGTGWRIVQEEWTALPPGSN